MKAKDVMSTTPEYLPPDATMKQAADLMKKHDYGFIPVGLNDRLIGAVTDRDMTVRGIAAGKDPNTTTLQEIMSTEIYYCFDYHDIESVAEKMETLQIRRLVVLNENKRLVGIISVGDIATKCKDKTLCSELIDAISEPA